MSQGDAREGFADVAELGGVGAQKLAAHRRVEEQVAHLDARAGRAVPGPHGTEFAAVTGDFRAAVCSGGRDCSVTCATPPMEASASPRKPSVPMRKRSSAVCSLLVA